MHPYPYLPIYKCKYDCSGRLNKRIQMKIRKTSPVKKRSLHRASFIKYNWPFTFDLTMEDRFLSFLCLFLSSCAVKYWLRSAVRALNLKGRTKVHFHGSSLLGVLRTQKSTNLTQVKCSHRVVSVRLMAQPIVALL